jgi:molybdopterin molybdotransferase
MSNFFELMEIDDFINLALKKMSKKKSEEIIHITKSLDRILAKDIHSMVNLPNFTRSVMDGYAVIAKDTYGASENVPVFLDCVGEVKMGEAADQEIISGQCIKVATGGMLPINANAVVMVEDTESISDDEIEVSRAVSEKENVVLKGEDLEKGELLLEKGHRIRPQDIGALAGIGIIEISVYKKINVAVFSTGDELISPEKEPALGEIRDINSYALTSFVKQINASAEMCGIVKDDHETLLEALKSKIGIYDVILLSGGSSVGTRDLTIDVLETLEKESILAHGIAIKPGKPTILSYIQKTLIIGLPGHPASSLVVFFYNNY